MGDTTYADAKNSPSPYANKNSQTPAQPAQPPALPAIKMVFFVVSSVTNKKIDEFVKAQMTWINFLWKPKDDDLKKFEVKLTWDGTFKSITDTKNAFRRIDFYSKTGAPTALQLVKDNYSNTSFDPEIPVFICEAAWDEDLEPGKPRDGLLRGFTLIKWLPWFTGERAILVFASAAVPKTTAHELTHWIGFTHKYYEDDPSNLGAIGGGGVAVDRDEFRKLHKWATDIAFRKQLATK